MSATVDPLLGDSELESLAGKRIVFFANVDWSFLSHRREIGAECVRRGAEVFLMAGDTGRIQEAEELGMTPIPLSLSRTGTNVWQESQSLFEIARELRRIRPDVLHNVSIKPMLYGSLAALGCRPRLVVNAVSGAGSLFDGGRLKQLVTRTAAMGLRLILRRPDIHWVFQNEDDLALYRSLGFIRGDQFIMTMGSGVDLDRFAPSPLPEAPQMLFASRLIWPKGIGLFVEAARRVRQVHPGVRFVIAGDPEDDNAARIGLDQMEQWVSEGDVEWAGIVDDVPKLMAESSVICLPSRYREGVPKVLLEAAASGRAVVAGDIPGARRALRHGIDGIIVDAESADELTEALLALLEDKDLLARYAAAARQRAEDTFAVDRVIEGHLGLYQRALESGGA